MLQAAHARQPWLWCLALTALWLTGCATPAPTPSLSTPLSSISPEEGCRAYANPVRRAHCVASCRATGATCPGTEPLLPRLTSRMSAQATLKGERAAERLREGQLHAALDDVTQARALWVLTGQNWRAARLIPLEARLLLELGRPQQAIERSQQGLPILQGTGDATSALQLNLVRGLAMLRLGRPGDALEEYAQATSLRKALGDSPDLAEVDLLFARLALALGRFDDAERAIPKPEQEDPDAFQGEVHRRRGQLLYRRGRLSEALGEHGLALAATGRAGHRAQVTRELLSIAELFVDLGRTDVAWRMASYGAGLAQQAPVLPEATQAQVLLGRIAEELGSVDEALDHYLKALSTDAGPLTAGQHFWAQAAGWRLCKGSRQCAPASFDFPVLPSGLHLVQDPEVVRPPLTPLTLLGTALVARELLTRGQRDQAERLLEGIESLLVVPLSPTMSWRVHHVVGLTWREMGSARNARRHFEQAQWALETLRGSVDVHGLRQTLSSSRRAVYEDLVDVRVGRSLPPPSSVDVAEAMATAERFKARGVTELLGQPRIDGERSAARAVRHQHVATALLGDMEAQAALAGPTQGGVWSVVPIAAQLCEVWSGMRWSGAEAATDEPVVMDFEAVPEALRRTLPKNAALLSYLVGPGRSYLWVARRDRLELFHLPGEAVLKQAVERHMNAMLKLRFEDKAAVREHRDAAWSLAQGVLIPAMGALKGAERLIVAPDGPLRGVPFSTLLASPELRRGGVPDYLLHHGALTHVPSAAAWLVLARRPTAQWLNAPRHGPFVAIGDPRRGAASGGGDPDAERFEIDVAFHDGAVTFTADHPELSVLADLKHSRRELRGIAGMMTAGATEVLLGQEATEDKLRSAGLEQARYVHFATHGLTDAQPMLPLGLLEQLGQEAAARLVRRAPALVLSRNPADQGDGLLRLDEILALDLDAELVVLSACSTGRGWQQMGASAYGLGGAFLIAGGRRAVASLWSVSDKATSALMVSFYRQILGGAAPDEAMRRAQLEALSGRKAPVGGIRGVEAVTNEAPSARPRGRSAARTPFYWAPFVVIGD